MNVERLVAGLDIGSAKTTAIIAEVVGDLPRHPGIKILGVGQSRTTGLRRGVVADIEETTQSIRKAVSEWLAHHGQPQWPDEVLSFTGMAEIPPFESNRGQLKPPAVDPLA